MEQEQSPMTQNPIEDVLSSLGVTGEAGSLTTMKETEDSCCHNNVFASDGTNDSLGLLDESIGQQSDGIEGVRIRDEGTQPVKGPPVMERGGNIPQTSSEVGGEGLEQIGVQEIKVGNGNDIHKFDDNEPDGSHPACLDENTEDIEVNITPDSVQGDAEIPPSLSLNDDGVQCFAREIHVKEVENGAECKDVELQSLSKSAQKQLAKHERYREIKMQRKTMEKEKRHQETARKRREWEEKLASLTEDEKEKVVFEKLNLRKERKDEQKTRKERLKQALETGQNLVIDLEFAELMKPNEIISLIQQVMYSYSANGKAAVPCRISLTGVRGQIQKQLEKISGFRNWVVHTEERSYVEVFEDRHSDLVYLTADSENILDSLDSSKIYIIGGLVDRNRWKNVTLEKANKQGIATAKLPIADHVKMMASQVLTVNQVMELLLCFSEVGDWKKALTKVVPLRKRAAEGSIKEPGVHEEALLA